MRITSLVQEYLKSHDVYPKCLCYCLNKRKCIRFAELLNNRGISAASVTANERENNTMDTILDSFYKGKTSVLCCNAGKWQLDWLFCA